MKKNGIKLMVGLFWIAGLSCSFFSKVLNTPSPTPTSEFELFSLSDALTFAIKTIDAENQNKTLLTQATNILIELSKSPTALKIEITNQYSILGEHHVAYGETLSCIGRGYGVLPNAIAEVNGIELLSELVLGQVLQIPAAEWTSITAGPLCPPQFSPPNWDSSPSISAEPTNNPKGSDFTPSEDSPPLTDQPPPPAPPIITTEPPPKDPPPPGPSEPPPEPSEPPPLPIDPICPFPCPIPTFSWP